MVVCALLRYHARQQVLAGRLAGADNRNCFKKVCTRFGGTVGTQSDEGLATRIVKQGSSPFLVSFHTPGAG